MMDEILGVQKGNRILKKNYKKHTVTDAVVSPNNPKYNTK